jgi:hypothetical protein
VFCHSKRWWGNDVPVGFNVGKLPEKLIGNRQACWNTIIFDANEQDASASMIREIVRECTDRLASLSRHVTAKRLLALGQIGFDVRKHGLKILVGVLGHSDELGWFWSFREHQVARASPALRRSHWRTSCEDSQSGSGTISRPVWGPEPILVCHTTRSFSAIRESRLRHETALSMLPPIQDYPNTNTAKQ